MSIGKGQPKVEMSPFGKFSLTQFMDHDKLFVVRGRGVAANMRPCQGRDRGFEPRRSRQTKKTTSKTKWFFCLIDLPIRLLQDMGCYEHQCYQFSLTKIII
jgi:hypothetical protein